MKRATFPYVLLVLLVFAWSLPMLVGAISSEHKGEKGKQEACSVAKGDHKGEHAKEHSAISSKHAEEKGLEKACSAGKEDYKGEHAKGYFMATWAEKKQQKGEFNERLMALKDKLQLEDEQVAELKALLEAKKEGLKATMDHLKEINASKEEFKKAIQEAKTGFEANLAEILTSEQAESYKELKTSFRKWRTKRPGEIGEKKSPLAKLSLTEDQKSKFNEITERYHEIQRDLSKQMMEELKEILTPEQIEEFGAMKARHMQLRSKPSKGKE